MTAVLTDTRNLQSSAPVRAVRAKNPYTRERKLLGDPTPLACTVAKTAVEIVLGRGGLEQLARWVTPAIRLALAEQHGLAHRAEITARGPVAIQRIRVFRVSNAAAEASIVVNDGLRTRAVAARFEDVGGRWQATALEIG